MTRVRHFVSGTFSELGKCTWPDKANLFESTLLVLFAIAVLALCVYIIDLLSQGLIRYLTTF